MTGTRTGRGSQGTCSICSDIYWFNPINGYLSRGASYTSIAEVTKAKAQSGEALRSFSALTISKHAKHWQKAKGQTARASKAFKVPEKPVPTVISQPPSNQIALSVPADLSDDDLAELIVRTTAQGVRAGELGVTVKDGLAAQSIIERRKERQEGQRLMITLARLLSGAGQGPPGMLIDGEAKDVTPVSYLAPPELSTDDLVGLVAQTEATLIESPEPESDDEPEDEAEDDVW